MYSHTIIHHEIYSILACNGLYIDRLVHLAHGFCSVLHRFSHGLMRLYSLKLERTTLQMGAHLNKLGNVLAGSNQVLKQASRQARVEQNR